MGIVDENEQALRGSRLGTYILIPTLSLVMGLPIFGLLLVIPIFLYFILVILKKSNTRLIDIALNFLGLAIYGGCVAMTNSPGNLSDQTIWNTVVPAIWSLIWLSTIQYRVKFIDF